MNSLSSKWSCQYSQRSTYSGMPHVSQRVNINTQPYYLQLVFCSTQLFPQLLGKMMNSYKDKK